MSIDTTVAGDLTIRQVSRRTGLAESALRYYERTERIDAVPRDESSGHRPKPSGPQSPDVKSKTLTERDAWEFAAANDVELSVINPSASSARPRQRPRRLDPDRRLATTTGGRHHGGHRREPARTSIRPN
jgi:hypothetical protein